MSFAQFPEGVSARDAVHIQPSDLLERPDGTLGSGTEVAVKAARVVAVTNQKALQDADVVAVITALQITDGFLGLSAENAVNLQISAVIVVENGLQRLDKRFVGFIAVDAVLRDAAVIAFVQPALNLLDFLVAGFGNVAVKQRAVDDNVRVAVSVDAADVPRFAVLPDVAVERVGSRPLRQPDAVTAAEIVVVEIIVEPIQIGISAKLLYIPMNAFFIPGTKSFVVK